MSMSNTEKHVKDIHEDIWKQTHIYSISNSTLSLQTIFS